ncbi:tail fiber domain-containing protein [Aeromonas hydrophila]|nr:tail fiber domain-containing protein [Aeromonas hydrophila]
MALWMNNGAVNVVNGSKAVTGVGTAFLTSANPARVGQPMIIADIFYEIEKVVSDTSILLATNYRGATANNVAYSVVTTAEGSSSDLARRAAQVMGYYQGQLDTLNALMAGTGSVTATLPDGTVVTLPAWSELTKIESIKPGTMQGPMAVANMKGAIKVNNQRSISFQDQAGTLYHALAFGNLFRMAYGNNAENSLLDISTGYIETYAALYTKAGAIVRNSSRTNWLGFETPESADPYISSKGLNEPAASIAMKFGSSISMEKPVNFVKGTYNFNSVNRAWTSYGLANYRAEEFTSGAGALRAALSYPFKIAGNYAVDCYIGTYADTQNQSGLCHVLGATDGGAFNPSWHFSLGGQLKYFSNASGGVGTINSISPMTGPSFTPTSDSRLKPIEDRQDIGEVSNFLRQLNPMYYFKKYALDSEQGFYEFGFIADEVEKHEPRLVFETKDEQRLKHLAINGIIPHLVKGWQEHDKTISQLQQLNLSGRLQVIERQLGILDADGVRQPS